MQKLERAIKAGDVLGVRALLSKGANANEAGPFGTPLYEAVESEKEEIVALLLEYGADVHGKDFVGRSPIQIAEAHEIKDCAKLISKSIIFDDLKPETVEVLLDSITPEQVSMLRGRSTHKYATSFQAKGMRLEIKKFNDIMSQTSEDNQKILNVIFYDFIETIFGHQALESVASKVPTLKVTVALSIWEKYEDLDLDGTISTSLLAFLSNPFDLQAYYTPQVLEVAGDSAAALDSE